MAKHCTRGRGGKKNHQPGNSFGAQSCSPAAHPPLLHDGRNSNGQLLGKACTQCGSSVEPIQMSTYSLRPTSYRRCVIICGTNEGGPPRATRRLTGPCGPRAPHARSAGHAPSDHVPQGNRKFAAPQAEPTSPIPPQAPQPAAQEAQKGHVWSGDGGGTSESH